MRLLPLLLTLVCGFPLFSPASPITLGSDGKSRAVVVVSPRVMENDHDISKIPGRSRDAQRELDRRRLRESARDLSVYLGKLGGTPPAEIVTSAQVVPAGKIPIYVGELAAEKFGPVGKTFPGKQAFRYVAGQRGLGLYGESDLASSYAIYELLDKLGCRWFIPGELGECIPSVERLEVNPEDYAKAPGTLCRQIWAADDAFRRRNRLGGINLQTGHALEGYLTKKDREAHPEFRAIVDGVPAEKRLKWSSKEVAHAIAEKITARLDKVPQDSVSLSPDDGAKFDESDDRKLDAGDFDPTFQTVSLTDRLMVLCNRIAGEVVKHHPDTLFGVLAYVQYTRPPVREKLHPNLIPQIAPISYDRAHPITDESAPNNAEYRKLLEGWARVAPRISYYPYAYYLAEISAPYPLIRKWSVDLPLYYKNNCAFWQPETTANFETTMHGLYLGMRLAWDPSQDPKAIIRELNERFYGNAAPAMTAYWNYIDSLWVDVPEYTGGDFGYLLRFTPEVMARARELIDAAVAACRTDLERERVKLAEVSFRQFEKYMKLREDYAAGRFARLAEENEAYRQELIALSQQYKDNYAFSAASWAKKSTHALVWHDDFKTVSYEDASRIANEFLILTEPLRFKFREDPNDHGGEQGWGAGEFDDSNWKETNPAVETWSTLGLYDYFGTVWYRRKLTLSDLPPGKKVFLWLGGTDGSAEVFVNGKEIPHVDPKTGETKVFRGFCRPVSFEITDALGEGENLIAIRTKRDFTNEIGTGGLLGPVVIYREK
jgi:hypothetical protein